MIFCPKCGNKLVESVVSHKTIKKCNCGFIDWDNWVNVSAVVVGFNDRNEFLMVSLKGKEQGKITFPGGYRDLYETLEEAAIREFYEETGLSINQLKLFKVYTRDDIRLVWIVYTAQIVEGEFKENSETERVLFYSKANLPKEKDLRGELTLQLLHDVLENYENIIENS